jgi:hypothetical protein
MCTADQCNSAGLCAHPPITDGSACHDDACIAGSCTSGVCQLGSTSTCDPCLACDGSGGCVPPIGCRIASARRSSVALRKAGDPARDSVSWSWEVGSGTTKSDFGTPLTTTDFDLCVYEQSSPVLSAHAPGGDVCGGVPCWHDLPTGFGYRDRELTPNGISKLDLKAGRSGKGTLRLSGKGANLSLPGRTLASPVTVRLMRRDSPACWEAVYSSPIRNDGFRFRARSD